MPKITDFEVTLYQKTDRGHHLLVLKSVHSFVFCIALPKRLIAYPNKYSSKYATADGHLLVQNFSVPLPGAAYEWVYKRADSQFEAVIEALKLEKELCN